MCYGLLISVLKHGYLVSPTSRTPTSRYTVVALGSLPQINSCGILHEDPLNPPVTPTDPWSAEGHPFENLLLFYRSHTSSPLSAVGPKP